MTKGNILYVEDHDDTRLMMTFMLEQDGFEVTSVGNGEDALTLATERQFDLYLLDHTFADISGVSLCNSIREFDKETPIIFYSGRALPQEKQAALDAGAQDYLIKPQDLLNVSKHAARWINWSNKAAI